MPLPARSAGQMGDKHDITIVGSITIVRSLAGR